MRTSSCPAAGPGLPILGQTFFDAFRKIVIQVFITVYALQAHAKNVPQPIDTQTSQRFAVDGVVMPITIDGSSRGTLKAIVEGPNVFIEPQPLLTWTAEIVIPSTQALLESRALKSNALSIEDLRFAGIEAMYDEALIEIRLKIPSGIRTTQALSFFTRPQGLETALRPEPYSALMNVSIAKAISAPQRESSSAETNSDALRAGLDGGLRIQNLVIESQASLREGATNTFIRGDSRVLYDNVKNAIRFSAGDLRYPVTGFQNFRQMGGVSMTKDDSLAPYDPIYPSSRDELILDSSATVDIAVDGAVIRSLRLPAGRFDFRDLPVGSGLSDIEIRIRDEFGRTRVIRRSFISDFELLKRGRARFTYNLGFPSTATGADRAYDSKRTTGSLFHEYGFADRLTFGVSLQTESKRTLAGAQTISAFSFGLLLFDLAASRTFPVARQGEDYSGAAARLRFRTLPQPRGFFHSNFITSSVETRSRHFAGIEIDLPSNPHAASFETALSSPLGAQWRILIGGGYQIPRDDNQVGRLASLGLVGRFKNGLSLDTTLSYRSNSFSTDEKRLFANLNWTDVTVDRASFASLSHDTTTQATRGTYQFNKDRHQLLSALQTTPLINQADVGYTYQSSRGDLGFRQLVDSDRTQSPSRVQGATEFSLSTALVATAGPSGLRGAIARPTSGAFAIVSADHSLPPLTANHRLRTTERSPSSEAELNALGAGVVSDLSPYTLRQIDIDTSGLPAGTTLVSDRFQLLPAYRSGYDLRLRLKSSVLIKGVLSTPLASGEICLLPRRQSVPCVEFFTNRKGRFIIEGLSPGLWVASSSNGEKFFEITIKNEMRGELDLGDVQDSGTRTETQP